MDGKIIIYSIFIAAIMAGITGFYYTMDVDEAQKEFILNQQQLGQVEESLKQVRSSYELRQEASAIITAAHIVERENEALREEIRAEQARRDSLAKSFLATIQRVREESVGMQFPQLVLTTGAVLQSVKLQSIDSELAVLQHAQGVSKVPTSALPEELQDRFRFGQSPGGNAGSEALPSIPPVQGAPSGASSSSSLQSPVSDALVRLGEGGPSNPTQPAKVMPTPSRNPDAVKMEGDPALWKSVQRQSVGYAYIPGQGWLKIGSKGPIPGSAR